MRLKTEVWLPEYTHFKAQNLAQFLECLRKIPQDSLYYHTYRHMFYYRLLSTDFQNSFAFWLYKNNFLVLAEKFSFINPLKFKDLEDLRKEFIRLITQNLKDVERPTSTFYFLKANRKIFTLKEEVKNLEDLREALKRMSLNSLFYFAVSSRLVNEEGESDLFIFLKSIGKEELAKRLESVLYSSLNLESFRERALALLNL